jgi:hypothetical protein
VTGTATSSPAALAVVIKISHVGELNIDTFFLNAILAMITIESPKQFWL